MAGFGLIGGSLGLGFSIGRAFGFGNTTWTGLGRQIFFRLLAIQLIFAQLPLFIKKLLLKILTTCLLQSKSCISDN